MSDYKQYRADFAKAIFLNTMARLPVYFTGQETQGAVLVSDFEMDEIQRGAIQGCVETADALIAELERTEEQERLHGILAEAPQAVPDQWHVDICGKTVSVPVTSYSEPPPAPALPRLNTGWKWADVGHIVTKWDKWWMCRRRFEQEDGTMFGVTRIPEHFPLATPDWNNPEDIEDPGEGYRFLVKGEMAQVGDCFCIPVTSKWIANTSPDESETQEWTHRTQRPLPPVLADEKEAQP